MFMKKVSDISTVISKVTFSPESGGKLNPKTAMLKKSILFSYTANYNRLPCNKYTRTDQVRKIVKCSSPQGDGDGDVNVLLGAAFVLDNVST